jgi:hypothetical protein
MWPADVSSLDLALAPKGFPTTSVSISAIRLPNQSNADKPISLKSRASNLFYGKGPRPLLWAGLPDAREKKITVNGITDRLNCVTFMVYTQFTNVVAGRII